MEKFFFFNRKRLSVIGAVIKFEKMTEFYSSSNIVFNGTPKYSEELNRLANQKTKKDFIYAGDGLYKIQSKVTKEFYKISIRKKNVTVKATLRKPYVYTAWLTAIFMI